MMMVMIMVLKYQPTVCQAMFYVVLTILSL